MSKLGFFSHYKWLDVHLPKFLDDCKVRGGWEWNGRIITAHGDKFYGYKSDFEKVGLHFAHGVAIGLLTYCHPYSLECRETKSGWVAPVDWICNNKDRFLPMLPPVDDTDKQFWI